MAEGVHKLQSNVTKFEDLATYIVTFHRLRLIVYI